MYKIGIEELDDKFYGVVVDEHDSIVYKDSDKNIKNLVKKLYNTLQISPHEIGYIGISTDLLNRFPATFQSFSSLVLIKIGYSEDNFLYRYNGYQLKLTDKLKIYTFFIKGAFKFDGKETSPLDRKKIVEIGEFINTHSFIQAVGIIGTFSNFFPTHEEEVERELRKLVNRDITISLSSKISSQSLIYREDLLVLNMIMISSAQKHIMNIANELKPFYNIENLYFLRFDGFLCSLKTALNYPILLTDATYASKIIACTKITNQPNIYLLMKNGSELVRISAYNMVPVIKYTWKKLFEKPVKIKTTVVKCLAFDRENINVVIKNIWKRDDNLIIVDNTLSANFENVTKEDVMYLNIDGFLGAFGVAAASIGISVEFLGIIQSNGRKELLEIAKTVAKNKILNERVEKSSIKVLGVEEKSISYLPWYTVRIKIVIKAKPLISE